MKKILWGLLGVVALAGSYAVIVQAQAPDSKPGCTYNNPALTISDKQSIGLQCDTNGQLKIAGTINASSSATATAANPSYVEGTSNPLSQNLSGQLRVTGSFASSGTATAAAPSYVEGTSNPLSQNLTGDQRVIAKQSGAWTVSGTGTAGSAATGVVTVQGIASMTPVQVSQATAANLNATIGNAAGASAVNIQDGGNSITVDGTVTVTDGAGALNVIVDSGTLTAVTSITNAVTVTDGAGALNVIVDSITAGANTIGNVVLVPSANAGGTTLFTLTLANSTNATNVKASAGQLYSISGFNMSSATPVWISLYNTAGTPTCGTGIIQQFLIPGATTGTGFVYDFAAPKGFATGIAFCATTGIAGTGNVAASTYVLNVDYK